MTGGVMFEDFSGFSQEAIEEETPEIDIEAVKLESYEKGYKSGWDDAVNQAADEHRDIGEELSRNLREARLTYEEAREEILSGVSTLLHEVIGTLLPSLLPEAVASAATIALDELSSKSADAISVSLSSSDFETTRSLLTENTESELSFLLEPALASGQARITLGEREVFIDVARLTETLSESLFEGAKANRGIHEE